MIVAFPTPAQGLVRDAGIGHAASLVEHRLAEWGDLVDDGSVPRLAYETRSHGGSYLFRVTPRKGGRAVAAKLFRERSFAGAEYRMAREVEDLPARVVRALRCDEELGLLVSEWVDGPPMTAARGWEEVADLASEAGEWLRRYHSEARLPSGPSHAGATYAQFFQSRRLPGFMDPEERREFAQVVEALASQAHLVLEPVRAVRLHGDFHPGNLIVTPDGLVAVDLLQGRSGSRFEDLARMTAYFAMTAETEGSGFDGELAREAFLDGYGLHGRGIERRLRVAEGMELMRRWYMSARPVVGAPLRARAARSLLRRRGWLDGR